jgi:hypothetical protein
MASMMTSLWAYVKTWLCASTSSQDERLRTHTSSPIFKWTPFLADWSFSLDSFCWSSALLSTWRHCQSTAGISRAASSAARAPKVLKFLEGPSAKFFISSSFGVILGPKFCVFPRILRICNRFEVPTYKYCTSKVIWPFRGSVSFPYKTIHCSYLHHCASSLHLALIQVALGFISPWDLLQLLIRHIWRHSICSRRFDILIMTSDLSYV